MALLSIRWKAAVAATMLAYIGLYGLARLSGRLVRYENLSEPQGQEIRAPIDAWRGLIGPDLPIGEGLDLLFLPMRKLEVSIRRGSVGKGRGVAANRSIRSDSRLLRSAV